MKKETKNFIFYEIGKSCRTEFLKKDGEFHPTEDAVVVGFSSGKTPEEAFIRLKKESPWIKEYEIDNLVAREIGRAFYLCWRLPPIFNNR